MDEREILEELRRLRPKGLSEEGERRILAAAAARAARIRARRRARGFLALAACLALYLAGGGPLLPTRGPGEQALPSVAARSALLETEARKALLEARLARLEMLASRVPGKSRALEVLKALKEELGRIEIPKPAKKNGDSRRAGKKEHKNSWIPRKKGEWNHA